MKTTQRGIEMKWTENVKKQTKVESETVLKEQIWTNISLTGLFTLKVWVFKKYIQMIFLMNCDTNEKDKC